MVAPVSRMFTIIQDTVGRHDFLLTPCSQEMFEILYTQKGYHPSCFENLLNSLKEHDTRSRRDIQHFYERQSRSAGKSDCRCAHVKIGRLH
ncbi:MAG: DUF1989 domain-containing protein [Nitrospirales bacterium]